jgi:hypothetical protein
VRCFVVNNSWAFSDFERALSFFFMEFIVKRFIVEEVPETKGITAVAQVQVYLDTNPHPDYHIASFIPGIYGNFIVWEWNGITYNERT